VPLKIGQSRAKSSINNSLANEFDCQMIPNLGQVLGIVARYEASEIFMHSDLDGWGAPSDAHDDVSRGKERRWREARKHAGAVAR
jgi:hypothetical protein